MSGLVGPRRWVAVAVAAAAFGLGFIGYRQAGGSSVLTAAYNTLGLFTLGFTEPPGSSTGSLPVALEIARFLAPIVTLLAAVGVAARLFRDHFDVVAARHARRHVVVCGLGRIGTATALRLQRQQYRVVAIERDPTCVNINTVRAHSIPVVIGDATSAAVRAHARIGRSGWFVWTPSEWIEGEAVVEALRDELDQAGTRRGSEEDDAPAALIRVRDLALCAMFRRDVLTHASPESAVDLDTDFFNEAENTAQRLLWQVTRGFVLAPRSAFELWLLGSGPLLESLCVQAVRNWWGTDTRPELVIRVFGEDAREIKERILARWPEIEPAGQLIAHPAAPDSCLDSHGPISSCRPRGVFVLVDDEEQALHLGRRFLEETSIPRIAVGATMRYPPVMQDPRLLFFDRVSYGLESDSLMFDTYELMGRMIHEHHNLRERVRPDGTLEPEAEPRGPGHEWHDLAPLWRASNRAAARFVVPNLQLAGFRITGLGAVGQSFDDVLPSFSAEQVEGMAEREHQRWVEFMMVRGWTQGPERDDDKKTRPGLLPWAEAPDADRAYTRGQVCATPRLLAQLGYRVVLDMPRDANH